MNPSHDVTQPKSTAQQKQDASKELLVEQLKKTPIVQVVCEKIGVSRASYYRWRKDDKGSQKRRIPPSWTAASW